MRQVAADGQRVDEKRTEGTAEPRQDMYNRNYQRWGIFRLAFFGDRWHLGDPIESPLVLDHATQRIKIGIRLHGTNCLTRWFPGQVVGLVVHGTLSNIATQLYILWGVQGFSRPRDDLVLCVTPWNLGIFN